MKLNTTHALLLAASLLAPATSTLAERILVPADQPTIQAAINAAEDGDVIDVRDGIYIETLTILGKSLTIGGMAGGHIQIHSPDGRHVIQPRDQSGLVGEVRFVSTSFYGHMPFEDLDPAQPGDDEGFRIEDWNVTFDRCNFNKLVSWYNDDNLLYGGAVVAYGSNLTFRNCRFEQNGVVSTKMRFAAIARGGAIHAHDCSLTLESTTFRWNYATATRHWGNLRGRYSAAAQGGALWASQSDLQITGGQFDGNAITMLQGGIEPDVAQGGAIYVTEPTTFKLERVGFEDNSSRREGGAIYNATSKRSAMGYIKSCTMRTNHAELGGGAYAGPGRAKSTNCTYDCNTTTQVEGGFIERGGNRFFECPQPRDPADVNGDGTVDKFDILAIYFNWGKAAPGNAYDLNTDGTVDSKDVIEVLKAMDPKSK